MPQHHLEPILERAINEARTAAISWAQRVVGLRQLADGWSRSSRRKNGRRERRGPLRARLRRWPQHGPRACSISRPTGARSSICYLLIDVKVDLDVANPRDYPYLAYFSDPHGMDDPGAPAALLALSLSGLAGCAGTHDRGPAREGRALRRRDQRAHRAQHESLHGAPPHRAGMAARPRVPDGRCRAPHHADVAARHEHRDTRRQQSAVAARLGAARLGR